MPSSNTTRSGTGFAPDFSSSSTNAVGLPFTFKPPRASNSSREDPLETTPPSVPFSSMSLGSAGGNTAGTGGNPTVGQMEGLLETTNAAFFALIL